VVEDTDPDLLVDVWSWIHISGLLAAFVAPLSGLVVGKFGLVPTMRGLYLLSFVMMTAKAIVMNALVTETTQGRIRMQETASEGFFTVLRGLGDVMRQIAKSPSTLYVLALMLVLNIAMTIRGTFWSILASRELGVSDARLALYPAVRSVTMLAFFFFGMPLVRRSIALGERDERLPMIAGFGLAVISQVILTVVAPGAEWLLLVATVLEGCSIPLTSTLLQKFTATTVDAHERARVMSMLAMAVLIVSSPFGWLAGQLSAVNRRLPFVLAAVLLGVAVV
jgi:Na+/melibiose symporter-like transporter